MFELPKLPYKRDALEPHISKRTIDFHYGQHHATYIKNLNTLIGGTTMEKMTLEDIVRQGTGSVFNNAAQAWNHSFYWHCMTPTPKNMPSGKLMEALNRDFGSFENFQQLFTKQSATLFGSGWTWLVADKDHKLSILQESNAGTPLTRDDVTPILTCDVWEHAYYLDQQNLRLAYINEFWKVVNWDFAEYNYGKNLGTELANKKEYSLYC